MPGDSDDRRKRPPIPTHDGDSDGSGRWIARLTPRRLALAALTAEIRAPETIRLGEPTSFYVLVRNRLPMPVAVETATSRLWGWSVDGVEEADRQVFEPPETGRRVRFGGLERKVFEATWDGRIREKRGGDAVWVDATGDHTLSGYLAVENPERYGLSAEAAVTVTDRGGDG